MNKISDIPSLNPVTAPIRPVSGRPSTLPSQLAPDAGARVDDVRLSSEARAAAPAAEQGFRADKVAQVRADIEAGLYSDEELDAKLDAILPRLLEDLKSV